MATFKKIEAQRAEYEIDLQAQLDAEKNRLKADRDKLDPIKQPKRSR
jgi:hypothetical protein